MLSPVTGQRAVFEALYVEHHRAVLRFAERRVDDAQVAQELTADVFAVAWHRVRKGDGDGIDLPWLYRTGANLISNHYRREARRRDGLRTLAESASHRSERDDDDALDVRLALGRLGAREHEVMALTYWEGLSASDIAAVMGISTSAVWTIQSRARAQLRVALSERTIERSQRDGR